MEVQEQNTTNKTWNFLLTRLGVRHRVTISRQAPTQQAALEMAIGMCENHEIKDYRITPIH